MAYKRSAAKAAEIVAALEDAGVPVGVVELDSFGGLALLPVEESGMPSQIATLRRVATRFGVRVTSTKFVWKLNGLPKTEVA